MSELIPFIYDGDELRSFLIDGEPWFVAADVARLLEYRDAYNMTRRLDEDDRGTRPVSTPSGMQRMTVISEAGFYTAILGSQCPGAKKIKRWLTHEVLPALRRTGRYGLDAPKGEQLLALAVLEAQAMLAAKDDRIAELEPMVEEGARFKRAIEGGAGLSVREFHKKYFSSVTEAAIWNHLYAKKYVINQLGKGSQRLSGPRAGTYRDGSQHRHPTYKGKPYFYRHADTNKAGRRYENTYVRPGKWELELRDRLASEGLPANENTAGLFNIEELDGAE